MANSSSAPPASAPEAEVTHVESVEGTSRDLVVVQGPTEHGVAIVRFKAEGPEEERVQVGELRAMREGQPIVGEVLKLTPRSEGPRMFDAEVIASAKTAIAGAISSSGSSASDSSPPSASGLAHKGPARVTSEAFRNNWDGIFGAKKPASGALN